MVRNIIIAIIAIIVLYFILDWAGIIGGGEQVEETMEEETIEEVEEAPAAGN
jgi:hypothetical protein